MAKKINIKEETRYLFPAFVMRDPGSRLLYYAWGAVIIAGAIITSLPFVWMIITSLIPGHAVFEQPLNALKYIKAADAGVYLKVFETAPFTKYIINSMIVTFSVVLGQVLISAMAAYSLSKLKPPMTGVILILFLSTIMIPFETIAIPLYLFMRDFPAGFTNINLLNSYWALILPGLSNAFNIFIFKSFFDKLPDDFIEAARVDGYTETGIFFKIIMPVSVSIMIIVGIMNFITVWNSFFWPLIVVNEPEMYTLMLGIYKIIEEGQPWNVVMAGVAVSMFPTFIIFSAFQKRIMKGIIFTTLQE